MRGFPTWPRVEIIKVSNSTCSSIILYTLILDFYLGDSNFWVYFLHITFFWKFTYWKSVSSLTFLAVQSLKMKTENRFIDPNIYGSSYTAHGSCCTGGNYLNSRRHSLYTQSAHKKTPGGRTFTYINIYCGARSEKIVNTIQFCCLKL